MIIINPLIKSYYVRVEYFVCMIEQFNAERCQVGTMAHQIQMFIKYGTKAG
jgi:hypothetical protein